MHHVLGKDPLAWSFVKLFGRHIACDLRGLEGLPGSHAWRWKTAGLWHSRLVTKAQCSGVVVSVIERLERVEFLVDDGTALVQAVLWGDGLHSPVALGDLVHVEGKLNVDRNWDATEPPRELRVLRISKVEDPNKELLHWTHVMELVGTYYSEPRHEKQSEAGAAPKEVQWGSIATDAFFSLSIRPRAKQQFLTSSDRDANDEVLLSSLEEFLLRQKMDDTQALRVAFSAQITAVADENGQTDRQSGITNKIKNIRSLQHVFRKLCRAGLLFLQDDEADRYILQSFELSLKPALLQLLREHSDGISIAEIADAILSRDSFQWIPLRWVEGGLNDC